MPRAHGLPDSPGFWQLHSDYPECREIRLPDCSGSVRPRGGSRVSAVDVSGRKTCPPAGSPSEGRDWPGTAGPPLTSWDVAGWPFVAPAASRPRLPDPSAREGVISMTTLAACVRITARQSAVWRRCCRCDVLAPLAPDQAHCRTCRTSPACKRRRCGRN
jgi:hypothetical protein